MQLETVRNKGKDNWAAEYLSKGDPEGRDAELPRRVNTRQCEGESV